MMEPITAAAVAVSVNKGIEKSTENFIGKLSLKFAKNQFEVLKFKLETGLPSYLEANSSKCESLKTLLNRNDPISLESCFVAPDFNLKGEVLSSSEFLRRINNNGGKIVVTGLAGSGKSVFLKYAFRKVLEEGYTFYPIFFELRSLNRVSPKSGMFLAEVYESIRSCCESFTRAQFDYGLRSGAFYFLLDGFDELNQDVRDVVSAEINELARSYYKCAVLVTSRPSDEFLSWDGFSESKLLPFDLEKVVNYIDKLNFDRDKKRDFIDDLNGGLFEENKDFLSNPLLASMMLLTYDSFGEIPQKKHIFYAKCFEVLAREHDASKGRYKRQLFSGLGMDSLEKAFMFFCAFSYADRIFSFNDNQIEKYVSDSISSCGLNVDTQAVIKDFRESISIMERVGLHHEFAHRSFQEYFYSKFVISDRKLTLNEKIGWLTQSFRSDDAVEMIADMDRTYFEEDFLFPQIRSLSKKISVFDPLTNPAGVISKFYSAVHISDTLDQNSDGVKRMYYTAARSGNIFLLRQALFKYWEVYADKLKSLVPDRGISQQEAVEKIEKLYGGEIKIHHSNNEKLIDIKATSFAVQIKSAISLLCEHLIEKRKLRDHGLGTMMRKRYVG